MHLKLVNMGGLMLSALTQIKNNPSDSKRSKFLWTDLVECFKVHAICYNSWLFNISKQSASL